MRRKKIIQSPFRQVAQEKLFSIPFVEAIQEKAREKYEMCFPFSFLLLCLLSVCTCARVICGVIFKITEN